MKNKEQVRRGEDMESDLLTVKEASALTRMSQQWWRRQMMFKAVPYVKIGSRVFIERSFINSMISNGKSPIK